MLWQRGLNYYYYKVVSVCNSKNPTLVWIFTEIKQLGLFFLDGGNAAGPDGVPAEAKRGKYFSKHAARTVCSQEAVTHTT